MVNLREDTRESIAKLTLMDDIFMNKVFENDTERTALLLRIILNNDKIKVIKAVTQQKLKNLSGHDLHLDILAQEENGRLFNVEVQNRSSTQSTLSSESAGCSQPAEGRIIPKAAG